LLPFPPRVFSIMFMGPLAASLPCSLAATSLWCGYHIAFGRWKLAKSLLHTHQLQTSISSIFKNFLIFIIEVTLNRV
jgi:hypothetical protein